MTRLIPPRDMTADQLLQCSADARALLYLIDYAAWGIQNGSGDVSNLSDSIGVASRLALELLEPVHDTLETHEGMTGGAS